MLKTNGIKEVIDTESNTHSYFNTRQSIPLPWKKNDQKENSASVILHSWYDISFRDVRNCISSRICSYKKRNTNKINHTPLTGPKFIWQKESKYPDYFYPDKMGGSPNPPPPEPFYPFSTRMEWKVQEKRTFIKKVGF